MSSKAFSGRHSVGYEITFFAVKPAPIATTPITKIHLDLSLAKRFLIELEGQNRRARAHHRHKHFYKTNYLVACLQINPTSKDITIKGRSAFKIPINTNTPSDIARYKAHLGTKRAESYPSELDGGIISGSIATLTPQVYQN